MTETCMKTSNKSRKKVTIRKYANRKHYDESTSAYVTMLDLSTMVAEGCSVRVVCDLSGVDLTAETLARALYERLKVRDRSKPFRVSRIAGLIRDIEVP
jgi:polyhydroxyalkanoate synthesis regulator protein